VFGFHRVAFVDSSPRIIAVAPRFIASRPRGALAPIATPFPIDRLPLQVSAPARARYEATMAIFYVNKERVDVGKSVPADTPLLWILRDSLNLTGTKYGCGMALCGACTVHIEGQPTRACQTPLSSIRQGAEITTIEGLSTKEGKALQAAWQALDVPQCGYCQSGQIMSAAALLAKNRHPSDADIDEAMAGNICRCATYVRIRAAIKEAGKRLSA